MAKAKQQATKTLYHRFFCGEGNLGESDGFFSLENGKLEYVDGWDANDAHWRQEYMSGLLAWAGVEIKQLPEKYLDEAVKIAEKVWGLDYGSDENEDEEHEREQVDLYFRDGTSDKVYSLELFSDETGNWRVDALYGRRGSDLRQENKCEAETYENAKAIYDKTLSQKLKKGYKEA